VPGDDGCDAAIEELYSLDPEGFLARRRALAARARQDGDAKTARAISALRRPTKAAWIINRLVRAQPDVAVGLAELGTRLRTAHRSLDGTALRQLTVQRRTIIDAAVRHAFALNGPAAPSASLRQEVAATLEAALADPEVAERLSAATLVRAEHWSGFGDSMPALSAVPPARPRGSAAKPPATASSAPQTRQRKAAATAEAVAQANRELRSAVAAEHDQDERVAMLVAQLADARRRQDEARLRTRQAKARQRDVHRRSDRTGH